MSHSPAGVRSSLGPSSSAMRVTDQRWLVAAAVVLLAVALAVLGLATRLDDGPAVRRSAVTTARTLGPIVALSGSDAGGAIHHRSGDQP